jgi:hypothetical protein
VVGARFQGVLLSLLAAAFLSGCGDDPNAPAPLQAAASSSVACTTGQGYQHTTLAYHLCFPDRWTSRDYTVEPGGGGAVSVVAFGPASEVPPHVPASGSYIPPIVIRVVGGPKAQAESSLARGNQLTKAVVAGITADKILVTDSGPANGAVIIVLEHQANTFEIAEAPGGTYDAAFQQMLDSFSFPAG